MNQDMFVDVEQGYSQENLSLLNKAVNAFAEFDPLVARVQQLATEGNWPREFALVTIAYYVLHRHKNDYHGAEADPRIPIPPVRITVEMVPSTANVIRELLAIVEAHPPLALTASGQAEVCALCHESPARGHKDDCTFERAVGRAHRLVMAA
jgi:hypothetical protein